MERAQRDAYGPLLEQGYVFRTNCRVDKVGEIRENLESQGFEIAVHPNALDRYGMPISGDMLAVLVREKQDIIPTPDCASTSD